MRASGPAVRPRLIEADPDESGEVDFDEFLVLMKKLAKESQEEYTAAQMRQFKEAFAKFDPDRVGVITLERFVEQWHRMGAQKKKGRYVHPSRRSAHHTSGTTPSYPCYRIFLAPLALLACSPRGDGRLNPRVAQIVLGGGAARNV